MPNQAIGITAGPTASGATDCPRLQTVPHIQWAEFGPMKVCLLVQHLWLLRNLGINLPQDSAIPLLGIYPKDALSYHKDIYLTVFIAALFVKAGTWKKPRYPSTGERLKKFLYIYTMKYYSVIHKHHILTFACKSMELENKNPE